MSGFNTDKRAEQLVPAITMFDGLDGVIFPLRVCLVAPTKTRKHLTTHADGGPAESGGELVASVCSSVRFSSLKWDNQIPIANCSILEKGQVSVTIAPG
jgi:hypothetical protein